MATQRPQKQDWDGIYKGEDIEQPLQTNPQTDITSWTIVAQIKAVDAAGEPTGDVLATGSITLTAPTSGGYSVHFTSAQTGALEPGRYFVDVWRMDSGSRKVLVEGFVPILPFETEF